jgi:hypothetical protein
LRGVDRCRRLRPRPGAGPAPERRGDRRACPRHRGTRDRPDRRLDERGVRRPAGRRVGLRSGRRPRPDQPVRRVEARRGDGGARGVCDGRPGVPVGGGTRAGDRPDGLALRTARQRLPGEDPRGRRPRGGIRRDAPARRRRDRLAELHRGRGRGDRRAHRLGGDRRHPSPRQRRPGHPCGLGARGPAPGPRRRPDGGRSRRDLAARLHPAALGRARADAASGREPLRPWQAALADYLPTLLRQHAAATR